MIHSIRRLLLVVVLAACTGTPAAIEDTSTQPISHHSRVTGIVRSNSGEPLDSVWVLLTASSRDGYYYFGPNQLTGPDGRFTLTLGRRPELPAALPLPDTITGLLRLSAVKQIDRLSDGSVPFQRYEVLLTFLPADSTPSTKSIDLQLSTPRR